MDIIFFKRDTAEWDFIWQWLEDHPINEGLEDPKSAINDGEAWQYMGTFRHDDSVVSEFRHRKHPATNSLYVASVSLINYNEDSIEKIVKIK